jgi:hypothetical protein
MLADRLLWRGVQTPNEKAVKVRLGFAARTINVQS